MNPLSSSNHDHKSDQLLETEETKRVDISKLLYRRKDLINQLQEQEQQNLKLWEEVNDRLDMSMAEKGKEKKVESQDRYKNSNTSSNSVNSSHSNNSFMVAIKYDIPTLKNNEKLSEEEKMELCTVLIRYLSLSNAERRVELKRLYNEQSQLYLKACGLSSEDISEHMSALSNPTLIAKEKSEVERNEVYDRYFGRFPEPMGMSDTYDKCKRQDAPQLPRQPAPRIQNDTKVGDTKVGVSSRTEKMTGSKSVSIKSSTTTPSASPFSSSPILSKVSKVNGHKEEEKRESWGLKSSSLFGGLLMKDKHKDKDKSKDKDKDKTFDHTSPPPRTATYSHLPPNINAHTRPKASPTIASIKKEDALSGL
ncbi:hypothetical protein RFI_18542 [Reticulomyxa filosa]|uniref:Uncharacterized protein n=1 Tax=Reticulomyxa filosa TaxID=46433 RepID=X6MYJ9_RETFI|nr:hypothetical protein RFI_18542 [Reticulomyxa filosa]|eukprot:ETO18713.1 hypothetical protein RFI_18542 [Reticulomyxa filosa]